MDTLGDVLSSVEGNGLPAYEKLLEGLIDPPVLIPFENLTCGEKRRVYAGYLEYKFVFRGGKCGLSIEAFYYQYGLAIGFNYFEE